MLRLRKLSLTFLFKGPTIDFPALGTPHPDNMFATLSLLTLVTVAQAHTIFQRVYVNGVDQGYLNGVRYPTVSIS